MLIGIDGNEANVENRVGVNQYGYELLRSLFGLQEEWGKNHRVIVYLKNKPLKDMPYETESFKYKVLPGGGMWILKNLVPDLYLSKPKPDVFFSPSHYIPPISSVPRVCSIMDLGYLKFSGQFKKYDFWQLKIWSALSIIISKYVIAISNSTKRDIVRHYPLASKKTIVTHLAHDKKRFNLKVDSHDVRRVQKKYSIVGSYVLFLSTLKPGKNVEGLLDAWSIISKKWPKIRLVITGKKGWLYQSIFGKVKSLSLENSVTFTGFIPEEDKPPLIRGAKLFVLPSFWEGFGLDVLNAMACGVPVAISRVASLTEVAGDAGIYFDPKDTRDIAIKINKVLLMDKAQYAKLVEKGLLQANRFSWEATARKTIRVLEKTAKT